MMETKRIIQEQNVWEGECRWVPGLRQGPGLGIRTLPVTGQAKRSNRSSGRMLGGSPGGTIFPLRDE